MNQYTPDQWVLLLIESDTVRVVKILSGWHGGYTQGDSWRLSSGVTKMIEHETEYEIHNESGSIYHCQKTCEGMTGMTASMLENWNNQNKDGKYKLEVLNAKEYYAVQ